MPSLIEELQRDALNQSISVVELLQKCLVVATKLKIHEFASWVSLELDGYNDQEVPEYRVIFGEPQVFNPYHGYQPLRFNDRRMAEMVSKMRWNNPIGMIETDLKQSPKNGPAYFQVSFLPAQEKMLMDAMQIPMKPSLRISGSQLRNILNAVRKIVLEWSLKMESDGIIGEGMTFSREEKEKAQSTTYNIKNFFHGNIEHSQVQVDSINSMQKSSSQELSVHQLKDFINKIKDSLDKLDIEGDDKAELVSEIRTLESQTDSPKPKASIIRESLASVRKILEGAAGNIVANGLLNLINLIK